MITSNYWTVLYFQWRAFQLPESGDRQLRPSSIAAVEDYCWYTYSAMARTSVDVATAHRKRPVSHQQAETHSAAGTRAQFVAARVVSRVGRVVRLQLVHVARTHMARAAEKSVAKNRRNAAAAPVVAPAMSVEKQEDPASWKVRLHLKSR